MIMWTYAIISTIVGLKLNIDEYSQGYANAGPYILYFIIASILGFVFAESLIQVKPTNLKFSLGYIFYLENKLKYFLYLSFLLGILKIIIIIKIFGFNTFADYRISYFQAGSIQNNFGYEHIFRISSYIYVLASFYIILLAIRQALTSFKLKFTLWSLLLFSTMSISMGGRTFILEFMLCFFMMFFFIKERRRLTLNKLEATLIGISFSFLILLVAIIGVLRTEETSQMSNSDIYGKYLYGRDGIIYTSNLFNTMPAGPQKLDYGKNITGVVIDKTNFSNFRINEDNKKYLPFITSVISPLLFDFGYYGSLFIWFLICFVAELISRKYTNNTTIWNLLLLYIIIRYFYDTPLNVTGGRAFFRYLFVLFILYLSQPYFIYNFREWQFHALKLFKKVGITNTDILKNKSIRKYLFG